MKTTKSKSICLSKSVFLLFVLFPLCFACNQKSGEGIINEMNKNDDPIEGVWELTNQFWVRDGDTLYLDPDEIPVKHKIYLDGFVIWTDEPTNDSLEWHGYGTYSLSNDSLVEKLVSMSLPMKVEAGSQGEVIYQVELGNGYCKQATNRLNRRRGTIYLVVEEWKKLNRRTIH